jgi:Flp pilus assembly protein TadG
MRKAIRDCNSGAAAIEFAAICPVLVLFLFGALYLGIYLSVAHSIQQLSADAARASIAGLDTDERRTISTAYVEKEASRYFLIRPQDVAVQADAPPSDPNAFEVTVSYDASTVLGWFPSGLIPGLDNHIQRASVILNGGAE